MKCCKEEMTTQFCPHCGKQADSSLFGLLSHIRVHRNVFAQSVERIELLTQTHPDNDSLARGLVLKKKILSKWDSWVEALQKVIGEK